MTLNSVEYNTNLVIDWKGKFTEYNNIVINGKYRENVNPCGKIGILIDSLIEIYPEKCELQLDGHTIYLPLEPGTAKAMSVNEDGNILWTELEAVTRHPPINKDGSNTLVKIVTKSGREAIATKAKSFLVYKDGKIIDKEGSDLKLGDLIPIVNKSYVDKNNLFLNLEQFFTKKRLEHNKIKSIIQLTENFGFTLGAYIAEGSKSDRSINISNIDNNYCEKAIQWIQEMNINYTFYNNAKDNGVRINNTILTEFMEIICGRGSFYKTIPYFAYSAPDEFVIGILDGILSGDGWVNKNGSVGLDVRSQEFRDGVGLLLTRFNIITNFSTLNKANKNDPDGEIKPIYRLYISTTYANKMKNIIKTLDYKHKRLINAINNCKN